LFFFNCYALVNLNALKREAFVINLSSSVGLMTSQPLQQFAWIKMLWTLCYSCSFHVLRVNNYLEPFKQPVRWQ